MSVTNMKYEGTLDTLTFGVNNIAVHESGLIGIKSSLSSSSSTSSASSATTSSSSSTSSQNSLTGIKLNHQMYKQKTNGSQQISSIKDLDSNVQTNNLKCPLCKNKLKEPKILTCLHVFCKQCLIAYSCQMSDCGDHNASSINCPKCKQETPIYEGIDHLQDDHIMENLLDMTAIEERIVDCTSCKTTDKAEARCADCAQYLCNTCVKAHQQMRCFDGHKVVKFEDIKRNSEQYINENNEKTDTNNDYRSQGGVPIHKPLFCKVHVKENLKFYCNTCQTPICAECVVKNHAQPLHQYERISDAELKNIQELEHLVEKAKEKINECNGDLTQSLDQYLADLQEKLEQSRDYINETHQSYKDILEKRKADLMKELEEKHSNKELLIMDMHNNLEQSVASLNDLIQFVHRCLKNGNCSEISLLKKMAVNQLELLTDNLPAVHSIDTNLKFQSDFSRFEKAVFETYGRFATEKELKQRYLNDLTSESNQNLSAFENNNNNNQQQRLIQMQQLQNKFENQSQSQQDWLMANQNNMKQGSQQQCQIQQNGVYRGGFNNYTTGIDDFNNQGQCDSQRRPPSSQNGPLGSPSSTPTDDWIRHCKKTGMQAVKTDDSQSTQNMLTGGHMQQNPLQASLSPQSSNSSNPNPWLNSNLTSLQQFQQQQILQNKLNAANNSSYQLTMAQQQQLLLNSIQNSNFLQIKNQGQPGARCNSPMDYMNMNNLQGQQIQGSRSNTPSLNLMGNSLMPPTQNTENNNTEEFIPFGANGNSTSITQNFNQLTKMMGPQVGLNELVVSGMNELGFNSGGGFSEIHSNSSKSPPDQHQQQLLSNLGTIGSGVNSIIAANQANQASFQGNGNLNPPVRQNGKMSNMQIRMKFGTLGAGKTQFNAPHGFCLGIDEEIVIADTNNHRIHIFDKQGEFKYSFGVPGKDETQLWHPRKITQFRDTGNFLICDRGSERSRMQIFSKTGHFVKLISIRYIDIVAGLAITLDGDIVAVDSVSPTVFRIDTKSGDLKKWFDCSDYMREPSDIAISGNEYYVCDFKGHCVVVFNEEGNYMRRIGGENITNFPNGIDVSDAGDVLIGDSHGNRFHVAVFSREGEMLSEFECPYVKVSRCCGLKITSEGYVITLAKNNHHVLVLNTLYVS